MTLATADLYDDRGDELDSLALQLRDFGGRTSFDGPVRTVRCHRDNGLVRQVLAAPGDGAVLVIDAAGSLESALLGDRTAAEAARNGWAGIIVHGAIRDAAAIAHIELGVKALGTNPRRSAKAGVGEIDANVTIAGIVFAPGKHVWADEDGVLVER